LECALGHKGHVAGHVAKQELQVDAAALHLLPRGQQGAAQQRTHNVAVAASEVAGLCLE
jgi:hypothetical protein